MAAGVVIGGMGYDSGNYSWVETMSPYGKVGHWEFTNSMFYAGAVGGGGSGRTGGAHFHPGVSEFDFGYRKSDDDLLAEAAGFQKDQFGNWNYSGKEECRSGFKMGVSGWEVMGRSFPDKNAAMKAIAECNNPGKKNGKGKCCCCCCKKGPPNYVEQPPFSYGGYRYIPQQPTYSQGNAQSGNNMIPNPYGDLLL